MNAKNSLTKENVMKNLFEMLINVNVINHVTMENIQIMKFECRKNLIDKSVDECSENIDENEMICNST